MQMFSALLESKWISFSETFLETLILLALLKADFKPRVNLAEDEKAFHLEAEIPGAKKEDINVEFKENRLVLKGERKEEKESKEKKSYIKESSYGFFERSFAFPENIDVKNTKASFKDGVLKLEIPKTEQKESVKKIEVK